MPIISKLMYVHLQRPDSGEWVTVGRHRTTAPGQGVFRYAPSYVGAGLAWAIDPKNLPFLPSVDIPAPLQYWVKAGNLDRWGACHRLRRDAADRKDAPSWFAQAERAG